MGWTWWIHRSASDIWMIISRPWPSQPLHEPVEPKDHAMKFARIGDLSALVCAATYQVGFHLLVRGFAFSPGLVFYDHPACHR